MPRRTSFFVSRIAVAAAALLSMLLVAPATGQAVTITSAGPITSITISPTLACQASAGGTLQFFGGDPGACETFIARGQTLFAPANFIAQSQTGVLGSGTAADPFTVSTVVCAGSAAECTGEIPVGPLVTSVVSYVVGQDFYRTDVQVTSRGTAETIGIYQYADCYLQGSDIGFGFFNPSTNGVYCASQPNNSPPGPIEGFVPISAGSTWAEGLFSAIRARIAGAPGAPLPNSCDPACDFSQDNGMALGWTGIALGTGSVTRSLLTAINVPAAAPTPPELPQATIASGPTGTVPTSTATFTFSSTDPTASFECSLDTAPFAPCTSPHTTAGLGNGPHTFNVRAVSAGGAVGTPASRSFAVAVPPVGGVSAPTDTDRDTIPDPSDNCATTPNANQADKDKDGVGDACDKSDASVGPTLGKTVIAKVVSGEVFVRLPAGRKPRGGARAAQAPSGTPAGYVPLKGAEVLPLGTVVHAVRGRLALTSAASRVKGRTKTQRAEFFDGIFQVRQKKAKRPVTDIKLQSPNFQKICGSSPRSAGASGAGSLHATASAAKKKRSKKVVSRLWGNGKGNFRTTGRHSAATVRGTIWLTQERCDGTLTRVTRGVVSVRDLTAGKTVTVRAGGSYLARAVRASVKTRRP